MLSDEKVRPIVVHPRWHKYVYLVIGAVLTVFTFVVLNQLTNQIEEARDVATNAVNRADEGYAGVQALEDQVKNLGATPVVSATDLPVPTQGERGLPGEAGPSGPPGPAGPSGSPGADGTNGANGVNGANGQDGASVVGPSGPPGPTGSPGPAGPRGEKGADGASGTNGQDGQDGQQGPAGPEGPSGPAGPAGPACRDGYTQSERTVLTTENPIAGERVIVCTPVNNAQE